MRTIKDMARARRAGQDVGAVNWKPHWAVTNDPKVIACFFDVEPDTRDYVVRVNGNEDEADMRAFFGLDVIIAFISEQAGAAKAFAEKVCSHRPVAVTLWNVEINATADWVLNGVGYGERGFLTNTLAKTPDWKIS